MALLNRHSFSLAYFYVFVFVYVLWSYVSRKIWNIIIRNKTFFISFFGFTQRKPFKIHSIESVKRTAPARTSERTTEIKINPFAFVWNVGGTNILFQNYFLSEILFQKPIHQYILVRHCFLSVFVWDNMKIIIIFGIWWFDLNENETKWRKTIFINLNNFGLLSIHNFLWEHWPSNACFNRSSPNHKMILFIFLF